MTALKNGTRGPGGTPRISTDQKLRSCPRQAQDIAEKSVYAFSFPVAVGPSWGNTPRTIATLLLGLCLLVLAGCNGPDPASEPDLVATQVAVERAAAATLTAEADATRQAQPTATPIPTQADTDSAATTPPTDTPAPTPTQILAYALPVDGSDESNRLRGSYVESNDGNNILLPGFSPAEVSDPMIFRDRLVYRIEVFDTEVGLNDGDGIQQIHFFVEDEFGEQVYDKIEEAPAFCLFGGNEPNCPPVDLTEPGVVWPGTTTEIKDGFYFTRAEITATSRESVEWRWSFEIQRGTAAPSPGDDTIYLRPACGTNVDVAAGVPLELRYGIWANKGLDLATRTEADIEIELTIDGQVVPGSRLLPPVESFGGICGRDYEDSYWVRHVTTIPGLAAGPHTARVTFRFRQPVEDGYGNTYSQPFTQEFILNAR